MLESWGMAVLAVLAAYLAGSIPTGYWYGRMRGIDIRTKGSGNIGATNIQRTLGSMAAVLVLAVDVAKGFVAAYFFSRLTVFPDADLLRVACGAAAILGHTFTLFLGFKGGKGVATTYGVLLALAPWTTLSVFLLFFIVVAVTRMVSAGSLVSAGLFPLGTWLFQEQGDYYSVLLLSLGIGIMLFTRHRSNLGRILRGEESRLGRPASSQKEKSE